MRFSKTARSSGVSCSTSTMTSRTCFQSPERSRVMLRLKLGRLSATTTPLRSKISPRVGGIGCTWTRLFSDRVEWYSYWITWRKYSRAINTQISATTAIAPNTTRPRTRRASFSWSLMRIGLGMRGELLVVRVAGQNCPGTIQLFTDQNPHQRVRQRQRRQRPALIGPRTDFRRQPFGAADHEVHRARVQPPAIEPARQLLG